MIEKGKSIGRRVFESGREFLLSLDPVHRKAKFITDVIRILDEHDRATLTPEEYKRVGFYVLLPGPLVHSIRAIGIRHPEAPIYAAESSDSPEK